MSFAFRSKYKFLNFREIILTLLPLNSKDIPEDLMSVKLHCAINNGNKEESIALINSGVNLNLIAYGRTSLDLAIINEQFDVACCIVENGATLVYPDISHQRMYPVHQASKTGSTILLKKMIEKYKYCVMQKDAAGLTALHWAASMGHLNAVILLIDNFSDMDARDDSLKTSLHRAIENGRTEVVKYLLNKNAKISLTDCRGWTALSTGVAHGNAGITKMMLEAGMDPNIKDKLGRNCLHLICNLESACICPVLAQTPMFRTNRLAKYASRSQSNQNLQIAFLLIDHGVNIFEEDYNHNSPLSLAIKHSKSELLILLLNAGGFLRQMKQEEEELLKKFGIAILCPPPLISMCKFAIRISLRKDISQKIKSLPLPSKLKSYLQLSSADLNEFI